jgi:hypothetical protein
VRRFLRQVDYAIAAHLGTADTVPLLVVGVDDIVSRYAAASHVPGVIPLALGNTAHVPAVELHGETWPTAHRMLRQPFERALAAAAGLRGTGLVVDRPDEAAEAAAEGQVATLLIADRWCGPVPGALEREPDDADAVNLAVAHTIRHRGTLGVLPSDELGPSGLLARLRY